MLVETCLGAQKPKKMRQEPRGRVGQAGLQAKRGLKRAPLLEADHGREETLRAACTVIHQTPYSDGSNSDPDLPPADLLYPAIIPSITCKY